MPDIELLPRTGFNGLPDRPYGLIASVPDETGMYKTTTGQEIFVDMSQVTTERVIVLTCKLFIGHLREPSLADPYLGSTTRRVTLSKKGEGTVTLSSYEKLRVKLHRPIGG